MLTKILKNIMIITTMMKNETSLCELFENHLEAY